MKNNFFRALFLAITFGIGAKLLVDNMKDKQVFPFLKKKFQMSLKAHNFKVFKIGHRPPKKEKLSLKIKPSYLVLFALIGISLWGSGFLGKYSYLLRTSLVGLQPVEFTGTIMPIEKVPNWVKLTDSERTLLYDQIPTSKLIPLPEYNVGKMQIGLQYATGHEEERNIWLTYPVPHLGNYKLDGTEYSGSHPGIDIKTPIGTPVHAIANGVVYKTETLTTGFGKHIVLAHVGVPDPENSNKNTTLLSGYAHLSEILVKEGQEIKKGDIIGKTGETGMATSPHLHFQIDKATAPYNLYWTFSWNDVTNAGLDSYFDAVTAGIGKSNGLLYTIHPVHFVENFENYVGPRNLVASTITEIPDTQETESTPVVSSEPETSQKTTPVTRTKVSSSEAQNNDDTPIVTFLTGRFYIPGEEKVIEVEVNEASVDLTQGIELSSTLRNLTQIVPSKLTADDFHAGIAQVKVKTNVERTFKLIAEGNFGEIRSESMRAMVFKDVDEGDSSATAIKYLKDKGVIDGYSDGTFRPDNTLNRAEAVKIILTANNISIIDRDPNFPDVPREAWFSNYVGTAVEHEIVKGYGDGTFKPENTISRAEFLKIAIESKGIPLPAIPERDPYLDVRSEDWFAQYFEIAKQNGILSTKRGGYVVPSQPITRAESADVIYKLDTMPQ